jgi:hypothetical protein
LSSGKDETPIASKRCPSPDKFKLTRSLARTRRS